MLEYRIGNGKDFIDIGYARRSDEDKKKQIQSIPRQKNWLRDQEKKWRIKLTKVWVDIKTAKAPGRPEFNDMIDFIYQADKPVRIWAWRLSRLSRNPIDEGTIKYLVTTGKIANVIVDGKIYDSQTNQILWGVDFGEATQKSLDLSRDVAEGMDDKVKKGYRPGLAPLGWINDPAGLQGEKKVFKDPDRFDTLKQQGQKIIDTKGVYKLADVKRHLDSIGFKTRNGKSVSFSRLYALFHNPFLMGEYLWKGKWQKSKASAMFTASEFEKLQIYIGRPGRVKRKHNHAFAGLIKCRECGCSFTPEPPKIKRQKNGNVHIYNYMRCTKKKAGVSCSQKCIRVEKLEAQLQKQLLDIQLHPHFLTWAADKIKKEKNIKPK